MLVTGARCTKPALSCKHSDVAAAGQFSLTMAT